MRVTLELSGGGFEFRWSHLDIQCCYMLLFERFSREEVATAQLPCASGINI